jgi:hypothetical protein
MKNKTPSDKKHKLLLAQLDIWINECDEQSKFLKNHDMEIASYGSDAMMQAYLIVRKYINDNQ